MIHLLPLPGSPRARPWQEVRDRALKDARALSEAGFVSLIVENYGDSPFFPDEVPTITVATMAAVVRDLREVLPGETWLGVNVLRNDARAALAVAKAGGAQGIRVNIHTGARVTDQGLVQGRAYETLRLRRAWDAEDVTILADVEVKHSAPLGQPRDPVVEVLDLAERGGADVVILSGDRTGAAVDEQRLATIRQACPGVRLAIGSGAEEASIGRLFRWADHVIVGTATKFGGKTEAAVDPQAARRLIAAADDAGALRR